MNIFFVDRDPVAAAQALCDKHIVKMPSESAIMLCNAFEHLEPPYKRAWYNNRFSVWTRSSAKNYDWHLRHAMALCEEYTFRYRKHHKSQDVIQWCADNLVWVFFDEVEFTKPAVPELVCHHADPVEAYRSYYHEEKSRFARWQRGRPPPEWWQH